MNYLEREEQKNKNWPILDDESEGMGTRMSAGEKIIEAWWWRSVENYAIAHGHPTYNEYAAMLLHQGHKRLRFPVDVFKFLKRKHGARKGIETGSYYRK